MRYYILENPQIWLAHSIWPIIQELEFCLIWNLWWNISHNISFHLRLFPVKTNAKIFQKILKNLLWGFFGPILSKFGHLTYPSKTGFLRGEGWNGYSIGNASIFSMWKSRFWLIINISFLVNWDHIRRQQGIFIPVITSYKICQDGTTLNITNLYMKIDSLKELLIIKFRASFSFRHSNKGSHQWNRTFIWKANTNGANSILGTHHEVTFFLMNGWKVFLWGSNKITRSTASMR